MGGECAPGWGKNYNSKKENGQYTSVRVANIARTGDKPGYCVFKRWGTDRDKICTLRP